MASPSTKNVAALKPKATGGVYYAPLGTALPANATTALAVTYKALGYISDEGLKPSRDVNTEKPKAWGGDIIAALVTDDSSSFEYTLEEVFSADVNNFVYGTANVTVTPATSSAGTTLAVLDKAYKPAQCVKVFEMWHEGKKVRIVLPVADPTVVSEEPYQDGTLTAYGIKVEALKDSSGVRAYRYYENDDKTA